MARKLAKVEREHVDVSERLAMPYARVLIPEAGGGYRAEILEFPGCIALGDDPAEALSSLESVAQDWLGAAEEMGSAIPPPFEDTDFSGRLGLRLPKSLHRKAALAAERDGVSLNQFIVTCIAESVGEKSRAKAQGPLFFHGINFVSAAHEPRAISLSSQWLTTTDTYLRSNLVLEGLDHARR
jgi:predicted RNase H-like HicB family nuclease